MLERELTPAEMIVGVTGEYAFARVRNRCRRSLFIRLIPKPGSGTVAKTLYFIVLKKDAFSLISKNIRRCEMLRPEHFHSLVDETEEKKKKRNYENQTN